MNYTDVLIEETEQLAEWITPELFDSIRPGDIIIAKIYQYGSTDHQARPVLVVNKSENEAYGFFITSTNENEHYDFYKVPIAELAGTGLTKASYINITREVNLKPQYISGPKPVIGHISKDDLLKLIKHLSDIFYVRSYPFKYNIKLVLNNLKQI